MESIAIGETGTILELFVQPGSKRNQIDGPHDHRLEIKIAARAVNGAANATCALHYGTFKSF